MRMHQCTVHTVEDVVSSKDDISKNEMNSKQLVESITGAFVLKSKAADTAVQFCYLIQDSNTGQTMMKGPFLCNVH